MNDFARYIIHHPEIFAVLLGWLFASGETWFGSQFYPIRWKKNKRRIVNISHSATAAFFWTLIMWKVLDYRSDDTIFTIVLASFGSAICTPMIQEIAVAFLNARLQRISGKKGPGLFKSAMKNLRFKSRKQ